MKLELSEMLKEAKADAPPPRYNVDDAVAAGRKLQVKRRAAWTGAATAAAVVAVAVGVAVPQLVTRDSAPNQAAPPAAAAAQPKQPLAYPESPWEYAFKGYTVGKYKVNDPFLVTANFQQATIRIGDELEEVYDGSATSSPKTPENPKGVPSKDDLKVAYSAPGSSLLLTVYRPGAFDPKLFAGGAKVSVDGKSGLYKDNVPIDGDGGPDGQGALAWQYGDDAWAAIYTTQPNDVAKKDFVKIAEGLSGTKAYPATVVTKLSYLPAGYRLTSGGRGSDWPNGAPSFQQTNLRLVKGDGEAAGKVTMPVFDNEDSKVQDIRINVFRTDFSEKRPPAGADATAAYCNSGNSTLCYRMLPGAKWQTEIEGSGKESADELKQVLDGVQFADVDDPSSWYPIESATP
jgi:hypothetical protein